MSSADVPDWLTLAGGERPVWTGRASLVRVGNRIAVAVALVVLGLVAPVVLPAGLWWASTIAVVGAVLVAAAATVRHRSVRYVVTTEAVYRRTGLLSREVTTVPLNRVQNTAYSQSPLQRLLSYGDVRLDTAGSAGTELVLEAVREPRHVAGVIAEQLGGDRAPA